MRGCMGAAASGKGLRPFLRVAALGVVAGGAWFGPQYWASTLRDSPWFITVGVGELAVLVALSPELSSWHPSFGLRLGRGRTEAVPGCATRRVPLQHSIRRLHRSAVFNQLSTYLVTDMPADHWRDGCWRFLTYDARYNGRSAIAVFAVSLKTRPDPLQAAIVDAEQNELLFSTQPAQG